MSVPSTLNAELAEPILQYWRAAMADAEFSKTEAGLSEGQCWFTSIEQLKQGLIPPDITAAAFRKYTEIVKENLRAAGKRDENVDPRSVKCLLRIGVFSPEHDHGKAMNERKLHRTLAIPAMLLSDGSLQAPNEGRSFVLRAYLTPMLNDNSLPIVGELQAQDSWFTKSPEEDLDRKTWSAWIEEAMSLFATIYADPSTSTGFVLLDNEAPSMPIGSIGLIPEEIGANRYILNYYDTLLNRKEYPDILNKLVTGNQGVRFDERRCKMAAANFRGHISRQYALGASQTLAMSGFVAMKDGDILAVNGPPGTGKTTLLQDVIATRVVNAVLNGASTPEIVFVTSTNNDAITNVNTSLARALQGRDGPISCRWLEVPDDVSVGLSAWLPSGNRVAEAKSSGIPFIEQYGRTYSGSIIEFEDQVSREFDVVQAKWLCHARAVFNREFDTISAALPALRERISACDVEHRNAVAAANNALSTARLWLGAKCANPDEYRSRIREKSNQLLRSIETKAAELEKLLTPLYEKRSAVEAQEIALKKSAGQVVVEASAVGVIEALLGWIPGLGSVLAKPRLAKAWATAVRDGCDGIFAPCRNRREPATWVAVLDLAITRIRSGNADLFKQIAHLDGELQACRQEISAVSQDTEKRLGEVEAAELVWQNTREELFSIFAKTDLRRDVIQERKLLAFDALDGAGLDAVLEASQLSFGADAFDLAMRFWEGRWIQEIPNRDYKNTGEKAVLARYRRWCMLTPALITTCYMLPKYAVYQPAKKANDDVWPAKGMLRSMIDLLIFDEAGQISTEIGAPLFAMAKSCVVVGDVEQLKPVYSIPRGIDLGNIRKYGLTDFAEEMTARGMLAHREAEGSVMKLAQSASDVNEDGIQERGLTLLEHHRCFPEIIQYCNKLCYGGRLKPMRRPSVGEVALYPRLGYGHAYGDAERSGSSWKNIGEANAIATWIDRNLDTIKAYYGISTDEDVRKTVAVITPFAAQKGVLRQAIRRLRRGDTGKMIIGTIHSLQGSEARIVIMSPTCTYHNRPRNLFYEQDNSMMNVAVSRAKDSFIVIGDTRMFHVGGRPTQLLADMMLKDPGNCLPDIGAILMLSGDHTSAQFERIDTLERHRSILKHAFGRAKRRLIVSSPFIAADAVTQDQLPELCRAAVERGVDVRFLFNPDLARKYDEPERLLISAGGKVRRTRGFHFKTLVIDDDEIIEGSFNWLSSVRRTNDAYSYAEASSLYTGAIAKQAIARFEKQVNELTDDWLSVMVPSDEPYAGH